MSGRGVKPFPGSIEHPSKGSLDASEAEVTVAIGCFDALTHFGLTTILGTDRRICVLASGLRGADLKDVLARATPHVVILDKTTELEQLKRIAPTTGLLVLAHEPSRAYRTEVLAAGAECLARALSAADLLAAVHLVAQGEPAFRSVDGHQVAHRQLDVRLLTGRELAVLKHLTKAKTNAEIAYALEISIRTVEKHVARICRKLDRDRRELVGCRSYSLEG